MQEYMGADAPAPSAPDNGLVPFSRLVKVLYCYRHGKILENALPVDKVTGIRPTRCPSKGCGAPLTGKGEWFVLPYDWRTFRSSTHP